MNLVLLANLESLNSEFIKLQLSKEERFGKLYEVAIYQLEILNSKDVTKSVKRSSDDTFLPSKD